MLKVKLPKYRIGDQFIIEDDTFSLDDYGKDINSYELVTVKYAASWCDGWIYCFQGENTHFINEDDPKIITKL